MDQERLVALLTREGLFAGVEPAQVAPLVDRGRLRKVARGEDVFAEGDDPDGLYVVVSGRIVITRVNEAGKEVILASLEAGRVFGEMALLDGAPRSANATAAEFGEVFVIERREFSRAVRADPDLAITLLAELSARLRAANALIESVSFLEIGPRLARLLLDLAGVDEADPPEGEAVLRRAYSQGELAKRIAAARENVNKQLRRWEEAGVIARGDKGLIRIPDVERLIDLATQED